MVELTISTSNEIRTEVVTKVNTPVASRARIASQNASALSRRRMTSLVGVGDAVKWSILDRRCIPGQGHKLEQYEAKY